jgi:GNAT superfamily N-acetyltransferase
LVIRRATPDLAGTLTSIAFTAKRHWGYPERWIEEWSPLLTVSVEFIERCDTFIAYQEGRPIGFYAISLEKRAARLDHLWVLPDFMGRGIGRRLLLHALTRCREVGVHTLEIESDPHAQGFYEKMGARRIGDTVGEVDGRPRSLPLLEIAITG